MALKAIFGSHTKQYRHARDYCEDILSSNPCSNGKGLGLCGSPMRSKVRIPLGANNSLGPTHRQCRSITISVWRGPCTWIRGLPDKGGYTK
jgi:hypothetical protein